MYLWRQPKWPSTKKMWKWEKLESGEDKERINKRMSLPGREERVVVSNLEGKG